MPSSIPEYYRQLAAQQQKPTRAAATPAQTPSETHPPYRAHRFTLGLPEEWKDQTVFILAGPVADGVQHGITINVASDVQVDSVAAYADVQTQALADQLQGCRLLLKDEVKLDNGLPAIRAIFSWWPSKERCLYQEQLYVLSVTEAFTLTATFSKKTRKTLGPSIERLMLGFTPAEGPGA